MSLEDNFDLPPELWPASPYDAQRVLDSVDTVLIGGLSDKDPLPAIDIMDIDTDVAPGVIMPEHEVEKMRQGYRQDAAGRGLSIEQWNAELTDQRLYNLHPVDGMSSFGIRRPYFSTDFLALVVSRYPVESAHQNQRVEIYAGKTGLSIVRESDKDNPQEAVMTVADCNQLVRQLGLTWLL